jgi:putative ABC transport system permease protein
MSWLAQDLQYGLRSLRRSPSSTAISILALGLGIGANSAVFSVVNAVLIRPLDYKDPTRLVILWETKLSQRIYQEATSPGDYKDFVERNKVFDGIGAIRAQPAVLTGGEMPERVATARVSPSVFELLGMHPSSGRSFAPDEDQPGKNQVAILSAGLWRRFGGDAGILGKPLLLDGRAYTVIGIAPPQFKLPDTPTDLWIPYTAEPKDLAPANRAVRTLKVIAHLKPGVTLERAQEEMRGIALGLEQAYADTNAGYSVDLKLLNEQLIGNIRPTLWTLLAAVNCVLLISCTNVAHLLLARAGAREKEMAVRTTLGANPGRLVRQLLAESVLLAGIGGVFGLALAYAAVAALSKLVPASVPRADQISIDWRVLVFTILVSLLTGLLFGLAPALAAARVDLNSMLKSSGRSTTGHRARIRLRDIFVVGQIASCVVLLIAAGLLIRSFARLQQVNPGFRTDHVLTMQLALPEVRYSGIQVGLFYQRLLERVQALPGVEASGISRFLPLSNRDASLNFQIQGQPPVGTVDQPRANFRAASAGYLTALRIPLLRGRDFDSSDGEHTPKVVIVNQTAARRYWPGQNPVGKRILSGLDDSEWSTIVGVVGDVKHTGLDAEVRPETYYHYLQIPPHWMNFAEATVALVIESRSDPASMTSSVRAAVRSLDPDLPVFNVKTMEDVVHGSVAEARFRTLLLAVFAGLALVLAMVGLYGVMSYSVTQRTQELGVRAALGAQPGDLLQLVVGHGLRLALGGVGIGLAVAIAGTRIISKMLFGVTAIDPVTFGVTCLGMLGVAVAASLIPAMRATRVDPATALRTE